MIILTCQPSTLSTQTKSNFHSSLSSILYLGDTPVEGERMVHAQPWLIRHSFD